eukprot:4930273-Amphidinium_carterae.3
MNIVPRSLRSFRRRGSTVDHNDIEDETLVGCALAFPLISTEAEALLHEGTVPECTSRLTVAYIAISFGHGLRGSLPSISGTVGLL